MSRSSRTSPVIGRQHSEISCVMTGPSMSAPSFASARCLLSRYAVSLPDHPPVRPERSGINAPPHLCEPRGIRHPNVQMPRCPGIQSVHTTSQGIKKLQQAQARSRVEMCSNQKQYVRLLLSKRVYIRTGDQARSTHDLAIFQATRIPRHVNLSRAPLQLC